MIEVLITALVIRGFLLYLESRGFRGKREMTDKERRDHYWGGLDPKEDV
jgi:hypothetical protein